VMIPQTAWAALLPMGGISLTSLSRWRCALA
jgi:hypothetical protein